MTFKVLGQVEPAATTHTTVYTVPATKATVVSNVAICNRGSTAATYRIAVRPAGASLVNKHYICYEVPINPYCTDHYAVGITLAATDVLAVYCSSANFSVSAFGDEQ